jgi:hypothetical protein
VEDTKIEHLKLIQGVISRVAGNSFLLKGWTVTLIAALFAFAAKDGDRTFAAIVWLPLLIFAFLDAYYLWREKLFIALYNDAATNNLHVNYSMDVGAYKATVTRWSAVRSPAIWGFYLPLAVLMIVLTFILFASPKPQATTVQGHKSVTITVE